MKTKKKDQFLYLEVFHKNTLSVVLMQTQNILNKALHNSISLKETAQK